MSTKTIYDQDTDSLLLSNKTAEDKVKGCATVGDFILDITTKKKIIGIEIKKASEFLKRLKITKNMLTKIEKANLIIDDRNPNRIVMWIELKLPKKEEKLKVPITLPTSYDASSEVAIA